MLGAGLGLSPQAVMGGRKFRLDPGNLLAAPDQFEAANWTKTNAAISADVAGVSSPGGTYAADKLVEDTGGAGKRLQQQATVSSGATVTLSIYAKAAGRSAINLFEAFSGKGAKFDLDAGTVSAADGASGLAAPTSSAISPAGGGWHRCLVTATVPGTAATLSLLLSNGTTPLYTGDGVSGVLLWRAQLVPGV